jgi:hypothetical protein
MSVRLIGLPFLALRYDADGMGGVASRLSGTSPTIGEAVTRRERQGRHDEIGDRRERLKGGSGGRAGEAQA